MIVCDRGCTVDVRGGNRQAGRQDRRGEVGMGREGGSQSDRPCGSCGPAQMPTLASPHLGPSTSPHLRPRPAHLVLPDESVDDAHAKAQA